MKSHHLLKITTSLAGLCLGAAGAATGATLCVNPGGTAGCYPTISAAVSAASATSVIQVGKGIYKESVVITQPLTLAGAGAIIDATGKGVGIFVNGMSAQPAAGIWLVNISGFTIKNANYEGILVANAVDVTISGNTLEGNNKGLNYAAGTCAGLPGYETNEGADCGEAIHLMAVHHSIVSGNIVTNNAGGMLLSDETGPTYENVITGNWVASRWPLTLRPPVCRKRRALASFATPSATTWSRITAISAKARESASSLPVPVPRIGAMWSRTTY